MARPDSIRHATVDEADELTALAVRSKAHWGYDDAFMRTCRSELVVDPATIALGETRVLVRDNVLVGFYSLAPIDDTSDELDLMFVDPRFIRTGAGRALWTDLLAQCNQRAIDAVEIVADPNAVSFYRAMGAEVVGTRRSPTTGRDLPLMRLDVRTPAQSTP